VLRGLRALPVVAIVATMLTVTSAPANAGERSPAAVGAHNDARRQAILHRCWPSGGAPGHVLVTAATPDAAARVASDEHGRLLDRRTVLLTVTPGDEASTAARLAPDPAVLAIEPDVVRAPALVPNDPQYSAQWAHTVANAPAAWDRTTGSSAVRVAVLDTGVDGSHPELLPNLAAQVDVSSGSVNDHNGTVGIDNDVCKVGHGTFVSGVIGAVGNNGDGVAGVAWHVSLYDVALASASSRCGILDSAIIAGLRYAVRTAHADIVNLSLGGVDDACPAALQGALDDARAAGTIVVAAAGNDEIDAPGATSVPGSCNGVVSVGAVGDGKQIAPYSDENQYVDLVAPGGDTSTGAGIVSTTRGGGYAAEQGTSFASPYVAGSMALLLAANPSLSPDALESIAEHTASYKGQTRDDVFGWGLVDVGAAVAAASAAVPTLVADPVFPVRAGGLDVQRVAPANGSIDPIQQAAAMSQRAFDDQQAFQAVIARSDDYADALAGSSLGFGLGPLLFSTSKGPLADTTKAELRRVLPTGSTVYLLGGTAALPASLDGEVRNLGYQVVRVAGTTRQRTAVAAAQQLELLLAENGFDPVRSVMVATAYNWPDAVSAGAIGAWFGVPILLTAPGALDPAADQFLRAGTWTNAYVIGGTAAISESVKNAVIDASHVGASNVARLAGTDRSGTTVSVSTEFERLFSVAFEEAFGSPGVPGLVVAVNLRAPGGYAHVLSASALIGEFSGVFLPVEGAAGDHITEAAQRYACRFPAGGVVVGGLRLITDPVHQLVDSLLKGDAAICTG
jgi:subtilisin family serine protease